MTEPLFDIDLIASAGKQRLVTVTLKTQTKQRWGDGWNARAAEPDTTHLVELQLHVPQRGPDARQILGRLLHAADNNESPGIVRGHLDTPDDYEAFLQDDKTRRRHPNATAIFYPHGADQVDGHVKMVQEYAEQVRIGIHDPPAVTVNQARAFSELGIALRADGIFGYKRKCARDGCANESSSGDCFGSLDPEEAIEGARQRDAVTCSNECWLDAGWGQEGGVDDLLNEWLNDKNHQSARATLMVAGCTECHSDEDEEVCYSDPENARLQLRPDWWPLAKAHALAKVVALDAANEAVEYGDYDGAEDAISCEA